jgi:AAA15 family ATPase/GTPase
MLRRFLLANHRSFRGEHELLLMPSYDNDWDVVPVAAILGANASGKSNLLDSCG